MFNFQKKKDIILPYFISFILPAAIFYIYFLCRNGEILTVDLGQQYIDFLNYFKSNLLTNPLALIYSFSQGLGDSFIGTFVYYLSSPFNLLLLLVPQGFIPQAILIIISLKVGAIGLSSYFYWSKRFDSYGKIYALTASLAYALSGFVLAYNLNLMWLDSVIMLPLVIEGIDRIFENKGFKFLLVTTFLTWLTNFYTGYMVLLFGFLYFLIQLFNNSSKKENLKEYFKASIFGSLIDLAFLLPLLFELLQGKTRVDSQFNFNWQFSIWKLISKLNTGSYSFDEMSSGLPNIYFSSIFLILALLFFISKKFNWKLKLGYGLLLIFLLLSFSFNPFVLLWHMGQFPVWYPARFSFIFIFFCINLAILSISKGTDLTNLQKITSLVFVVILSLAWWFTKNQFNFLNETKVLISISFLICSFLLICFLDKKYAPILCFLLVGFEVSINLIMSLDSIDYQLNSTYINFTKATRQASSFVQSKDKTLYRTEKTFNHTEDDPFSGNYYGVSLFNSVSNHRVLNLVRQLGLKSNDNSFSNQYSDLLTDSILGIKYYYVPTLKRRSLAKNEQLIFNETYYRPDLYNNSVFHNFEQIQIRKNNLALPLLFASPNSSKDPKFVAFSPLYNQNQLFNAMTGYNKDLLTNMIWPKPQLINVKEDPKVLGQYSEKNSTEESSIIFDFVPQSDDTYYLELGPDLNSKAASLSINGHYINTNELNNQTHVITLAYKAKHQKIQIKFDLQHSTINFNSCRIVRFDNALFKKEATSFIKKQAKIYQDTALSLSFRTSLSQSKTINSTIPYSSNWFVFDNGKRIKTAMFADTFLSFKLSKGQHNIKLIYIPITFIIGIVLSLFSLLIYLKFFRK